MIVPRLHLTQVTAALRHSFTAYDWVSTHPITLIGDRMKPLRITGLALPIALAAGQPTTPAANPITAAFKARIAVIHRNIAQAFDSIPESKFGYKPTPAQRTFGDVAQHVASDSYVFCSNFGAMKPTIDAKDTSTPDSVKATWPKAELVSKLKASFAFCDQAIEQVTDASLPDAISFTYGGAERKSTRVNMLLLHALDLADHYSQIANYMRLNGMLPPSALPRPGRGGD
jgi:uncharacterized damage-inducible protein DinB